MAEFGICQSTGLERPVGRGSHKSRFPWDALQARITHTGPVVVTAGDQMNQVGTAQRTSHLIGLISHTSKPPIPAILDCSWKVYPGTDVNLPRCVVYATLQAGPLYLGGEVSHVRGRTWFLLCVCTRIVNDSDNAGEIGTHPSDYIVAAWQPISNHFVSSM